MPRFCGSGGVDKSSLPWFDRWAVRPYSKRKSKLISKSHLSLMPFSQEGRGLALLYKL